MSSRLTSKSERSEGSRGGIEHSATPRVILERSEGSRGGTAIRFAITVSKKCYFTSRKVNQTQRRSLRRFAPRFLLDSFLISQKVRLRSG